MDQFRAHLICSRSHCTTGLTVNTVGRLKQTLIRLPLVRWWGPGCCFHRRRCCHFSHSAVSAGATSQRRSRISAQPDLRKLGSWESAEPRCSCAQIGPRQPAILLRLGETTCGSAFHSNSQASGILNEGSFAQGERRRPWSLVRNLRSASGVVTTGYPSTIVGDVASGAVCGRARSRPLNSAKTITQSERSVFETLEDKVKKPARKK